MTRPNEGFLRMASLYVGQALFQPGEYITHVNDLATEIYYIKHGMVRLLNEAIAVDIF